MSNEASPEPRKSGETRQQRAQRPAWIAGGVLILIGIVFIVQNVAGVTLNNWWALFILIPAIGLLVTTYQTLAEKRQAVHGGVPRAPDRRPGPPGGHGGLSLQPGLGQGVAAFSDPGGAGGASQLPAEKELNGQKLRVTITPRDTTHV